MWLDSNNSHGHDDDRHQSSTSSDTGEGRGSGGDGCSGSSSGGDEPLHASFRRNLSSTFSSFSPSSPASPGNRGLLKKSNLRKSLRRLDSSHRLSITCSGSDLSQLYLSSPELDALNIILSPPSPSSRSPGRSDLDNNDGSLRRNNSSSSGWLQAADLYGTRKSFRRNSSYTNFLDMDVMSDIIELDDDEEERIMLLIEETNDDYDDYLLSEETKRPTPSTTRQNNKCLRRIKKCIQSPAIVVPIMMLVDLILGVVLSLYDSNLLRNVPGFRFPLCYAFTQKLTNALASFILICLSRRWEVEERARARMVEQQQQYHASTFSPAIISNDENDRPLTELPSARTFRHHLVPLSAVALVQTVSSAFANQALQIIPLPLFKVCLMCGPIFVALITSIVEGHYQLYSRGRLLALCLIGVGACRAVYAEAEGADNPRYVMEGAGYALGASAFSGIGLVLSSVLMHRGGGGNDQEENNDNGEKFGNEEKPESKMEEVELNPLSLLFYLSCEQVLMLSAYLCPWDVLLQENEGEIREDGEFAAFAIYFTQNPTVTILYLMTGSMMSLTLAVLTFALVNRTSPVATSLLGNARSIATVAISSAVFGNVSSGGSSAAFGYALTLAGGVAYALAALGS